MLEFGTAPPCGWFCSRAGKTAATINDDFCFFFLSPSSSSTLKQALSLLPPYYSPNERGRGAAGSLHSARRSPQTPRRSPQKFRCQLLRRVNFNWLVLRIEKNEYGDNIKCTPGSLARLSFHLSAAQKRSLLRQVCIVCKYQKWHSGYILLSPGFKTIRTCGCAEERARLMEGVDGRCTITFNWSDFVKTSQIGKHQMCVFAFKTKKGELSLPALRRTVKKL